MQRAKTNARSGASEFFTDDYVVSERAKTIQLSTAPPPNGVPSPLLFGGGTEPELNNTPLLRHRRPSVTLEAMSDPAAIIWIRVGDRFPDLKHEEHHFIALDADGHDIGIVQRIEHGRQTGGWQWSMTRVNDSAPFDRPRSGMTETRDEAARELIECWRAFRRYYGLED